MLKSITIRWLSYLGALAASVVALLVASTPLIPAKAQAYVGFGLAPLGFEVGIPYYNYPPAYYPPSYAFNYYAPGYYSSYSWYYPNYNYSGYYPSYYSGYYYPTYW